jgi:hypothetical protein
VRIRGPNPYRARRRKCIISCFDEFMIRHIPREENGRANTLAQLATVYKVVKKYFHVRKPMHVNPKL